MTTTPNIKLTLPNPGSSSWDVPLNNNFLQVDQSMGFLQTQIDQLNLSMSGTEKLINKGVASGYAPLDSTGKVPLTNLPSGGSGSVTSVALTLPSWLTVSGSPITTGGTLAVSVASGQTAKSFLATPTSTTGSLGLRTIVAGDLTGAVFGASGTNHSVGVVPDPGFSVSTAHFLREDATWAIPSSGSGTPGGSTGQLQWNNTNAFAGANIFTDGNNLFHAGPIPYRDITSFEGVPGTSCFSAETVLGSITASGSLLTVNGGTWINGCSVGIANAGPATSLSAPTIASVAFTPVTMQVATNGFVRLSNVVTVTLVSDASIAVGDTIIISGATGCSTTVNGTRIVTSTGWAPNVNNPTGNIFTFSQTAGNETCGGDNGDSSSPATIVVQSSTAHYSYKVAAMDFNNGLTAPTSATTITTSVPTLQGMEPNTVTINCVTNGASYPVWRQTNGVGNFIYIGSALPCGPGYITQTTTLKDFGQSYGVVQSGVTIQTPIGIPINVPSGPLGQILIAKILAGGGTTTLTLNTSAVSTVSNVTTYHDNTTAFNAALVAARTDLGGNTVVIPNTILPRFCNIDLSTPVLFPACPSFNSGVTIRVDGGLWPSCVINKVYGGYNLVGNGTWSGSGNFNATDKGIGAQFVTGDLNPTIFDTSNHSVIQGFTFGISPNVLPGFTGNGVGLGAFTQIHAVGGSDGIFSDISCAQNANAISPCIVLDGCSGTGGMFGMSFTRVNFEGGANFPVPSGAFRCSGDMNFNSTFISQRALYFDNYTVGVEDGGGFFFNNFQGFGGSEALHEPYMIQTNFDNSGNLGGITISNLNPADPLYGFNSIIQDTSAARQSGLNISGSTISGSLVFGKPFTSAIFTNTGESGLGGQSTGTYSWLGTGPVMFSNGTGILGNALAISKGGIIIGGNVLTGDAGQLANIGGLVIADQVSGRTGMSAAGLGDAGNNLLWIDSADPVSSRTFWTGANSQTTQLAFMTPDNLSTGSIAINHTNLGGILSISQNSFAVSLYGQNNGNYTAGDFSVPGALAFASLTHPMRLTGTPTVPRNFIFPDTNGTMVVYTSTPSTGHVANFSVTSGVVTLSDGGIGMTNPMTTSGDLTYGGSSGVPTRLASGTTHQILHSGSTPSWGSIDLSTEVGSSILSAINGGTGVNDFSFSGTAHKVAGISGTLTVGNLPKIDASSNLVDSGVGIPISATTGVITPGSLAAGACASTTVSISGATTSMVAATSPSIYPGDGSFWLAYVSAANTVTVKVCASVSMSPGASTYNVRLLQ